MNAVILAGGKGTKIWPYAEIRNKGMIRISNTPVLKHTVSCLRESGINNIHIISSSFTKEINHCFKDDNNVFVHHINETNGSADTLLAFEQYAEDNFIVLFNDCLIQKYDINSLVNSDSDTLLVSKSIDSCRNHIIVRTDDTKIKDLIGHPRGIDEGYVLYGANLNKTFFKYLKFNSGKFNNTKVGVGSLLESYLEESLNEYLKENTLTYIESKYQCFDIDKPWNILEANSYNNEIICSEIKENIMGENSTISQEANISGYVKLGKNSSIGKNVIITGNCIIGDNTIIDNGAIIHGNTVIGNNCIIRNYCKIGGNSTIGDECIIEQTAELISGLLMKKVYLYHHGEFYGLCGENVDLGAGTVCGTLRFDDGETTHICNGRKEIPTNYSNATYLGDYVRTGVGVIFQPGAMVGVQSVIGSGVVLNQKVLNNKLIYLKQELIESDWGANKYGW